MYHTYATPGNYQVQFSYSQINPTTQCLVFDSINSAIYDSCTAILQINTIDSISYEFIIDWNGVDLDPEKADPASAVLYLEASVDTTTINSNVSISVKLGTNGFPADSIYGIVFDLGYFNELVDTNNMTIQMSNSWLGDIQNTNDFIAIDTNFRSNGSWKTGMTRTDQVFKNGFGEIAMIDIVTVDDLSGLTVDNYALLNLTLGNIQAIDHQGNQIALTVEHDSVYIGSFASSIKDFSSETNIFRIYPNPSSGYFKVSMNIAKAKMTISNSLGQNIRREQVQNRQEIDVNSLSKGTYFVQFSNNDLVSKSLKLILK